MTRSLAAVIEEMKNNDRVNWYITSEGNYTVDCNIHRNVLELNKIWKFGSTAVDESISIYWYQKVIELLEHLNEHTNEIIPILKDTTEEEIRTMCYRINRTIMNLL